ncbi:MAG: efflux RND transporter permease subunit [Deltaproteobacteria bacterium]|nr:efflux RND transporter permease subunit [Deltaproteobacteria bacterium]
MNLSELFIRRPVMTTLVMLAILLFGIIGYKLLSVSDLPNVDFPVIQVMATLPGASPETMASAIATPLERQFTTISGLNAMYSSSMLGATQITLMFDLSKNIDAAAQDVQAAITAASPQLPQGMPSPPIYQKVNPADMPIVYISLTSKTLPLYTLDYFGETIMAERISMINGVSQVLVYGSQKYAVRVQVNPTILSGLWLGIDQVASAIQTSNVELPTGVLDGEHSAYTIQANGQLTDASAFMPVIVAYHNGSPVRIKDIGRAIDSVENDKTAAWYANTSENTFQRAIVLAVERQPGSNIVGVADAVKKLLPEFKRDLPASVTMHLLFDRSTSIKESINDVKTTLIIALILVILVIFVFLRNLSATIIPSLSLPLSIFGTFAVMYLLGYTIDNLSMMALVLAIGFVIDDAIVMLENIVRHVEMGEGPFEAALNGSKEISFTILSMTLSLAAVFIPILFMGGIIGKLFHEFAVTIGVSILVSGFVSLTLTPMLTSRFIKSIEPKEHSKLYKLSERGFDAMLNAYKRSLRWVLLHKRATIVFSVVILLLTGLLFAEVPKGFMPSEDLGEIFGITEAAQGISFKSMVKHQIEVANVIRQNPNVDAFMTSCGARAGITSSNSGVVFMRLKPKSERKLSPEQIIQQLYPKLVKIPGIRVFLQNPPPIQLSGRFTKSLYQYTLQGTNTGELYKNAQIMEARMKTLPGLMDVTSDLEISNPQVNLTIERNKASELGVTAYQIENALSYAYSSTQVSTIYAPDNEYKVILELLPRYQEDPSVLSLLYIRSSSGTLVPLDSVVSMEKTVGPLQVNHTGQLPSVTISFNLLPGVSLGNAVSEIDGLAHKTIPANIITSFQGTAQAFESSMKGLGMLLIMTILIIYMVLGILYESFIHPITILSALPFAGFGALLTLLIFHVDLNIYSFVGIIMLVGLVKKNGIMMIDFAIEAERKEGKNSTDSIYEACVIRFRPIMMTTVAAIIGTLPIAIGLGAGAGSRQPLGLAVVGGLLFSQFLTLYITPVFYIYMDSFSKWLPKALHIGRKTQP